MIIESPAYLMLKHAKINSNLEYKSLLLAINTFDQPAKINAEIGIVDNREQETSLPLRLQGRFGRKARIMSCLSATLRRAETQRLEQNRATINVNTHGKRPRYY